MQKVKYEVDPHNRLVVGRRFRRVLDGRFNVASGNTLIYHIKAPMGRGRKLPHQVKLKGKWALTRNHDLKLTLDKWRRQRPGDELTLRGEIIAVEKNSLLFAVTTRTAKNIAITDILKLQGIWQADKHNRLTFRAKKGKGKHDTLTLNGIWEINKHHRIVYTYEKSKLLRKEKLKRAIEFSGFWDIKKRNRLFYYLSRDRLSGFEFKTSLGRVYKNYIKYELGIGKAAKKRIITLFGRWRIKRNTGLLFEIEQEKGKISAIVFGADVKLTKKDRLEFKLKSELNQDLGLKLQLSRRLIKGDGQAFLKLLKDKDQARISVGMAWRW